MQEHEGKNEMRIPPFSHSLNFTSFTTSTALPLGQTDAVRVSTLRKERRKNRRLNLAIFPNVLTKEYKNKDGYGKVSYSQ